MFVNLNDLICYMDSYAVAYLDPETCKCYFEHDLLHDNRSQYLLIPKIDELQIIHQYINQSSEKSIKRIPKDHPKLLETFHKRANDCNLYDDWIEFKTKALLNIAAKWCEENFIHFTQKQVHS